MTTTTTTTTKTFELILTCADGLEHALMIELASFGIAASQHATGRVIACVTLCQLYHICLYSRVASRVLLPLAEYYFVNTQKDNVTVITEDIPSVLYEFTKRYDWSQLLDVHQTFVIRTSVDKRVAVNQQFVTMRIKDGIADRFNAQFGARPSVDTQKPNLIISVHIAPDKALFALDLSGASLHRRGYRVANTDAPLKENLAAALLYTADWHRKRFDVLFDPMCGSGTFIIEALLMSLDYAVGVDKASDEFGFCHWREHDEALWQSLVLQAQDKFHHNLQHAKLPKTYAFDNNPIAIKALHKNILASALAPVIDKIEFAVQELSELPKTLQALGDDDALFFITNPPYGERLGESELLKPLYQGMGLMLRQYAPMHTTVGVLAAKAEEADLLPLLTPQTLRCHNGALTVYFRYGQLNTAPQPMIIDVYEPRCVVIENDDNLDEFINRLQKNLNHLKKTAQKQQVSNLRIYDADLPNYNAAIDIYGDKVHIQEYAPPKTIDETVAKRRFNLMLLAVRQVLNVDREAIFIKTRAKQSGNEQYERHTSKKGKRYVVSEHGALLYVNFTDYLDTGLFIDHRPMRQIIKQRAQHKSVLNLYAYTCTASVQAAMGGAKKIVSVDLSDNYLTWGKHNFALNGFELDARFEFVSADVFEWIKHNSESFDVIFIDPPTFSNSKKFYGTFDVQRDHVSLIKRAMNRLTHDGVLYFSNNFSKFVMDESLLQLFDVQEMTHKTTGFDFKKGIHKSYEIRHKNQRRQVYVEDVQNFGGANDSDGAKPKNNSSLVARPLHSNHTKDPNRTGSNGAFDSGAGIKKSPRQNSQSQNNQGQNNQGQNNQSENRNGQNSRGENNHKNRPSKSDERKTPKTQTPKTAKSDKPKFDKSAHKYASNKNKAFGQDKPKGFEKRLIATGDNKRVFVNPKHQMVNQSDEESK